MDAKGPGSEQAAKEARRSWRDGRGWRPARAVDRAGGKAFRWSRVPARRGAQRVGAFPPTQGLTHGRGDSGRWRGQGHGGGRIRLGSVRCGRRRRESRATVGECGCGASRTIARITPHGRWPRSGAYKTSPCSRAPGRNRLRKVSALANSRGFDVANRIVVVLFYQIDIMKSLIFGRSRRTWPRFSTSIYENSTVRQEWKNMPDGVFRKHHYQEAIVISRTAKTTTGEAKRCAPSENRTLTLSWNYDDKVEISPGTLPQTPGFYRHYRRLQSLYCRDMTV